MQFLRQPLKMFANAEYLFKMWLFEAESIARQKGELKTVK